MDAAGITRETGVMARVIEDSLDQSGLEGWHAVLSAATPFEPRGKSQYLPGVGVGFTIPVNIPLIDRSSAGQAGKGAESGETDDLWEKHSGATGPGSEGLQPVPGMGIFPGMVPRMYGGTPGMMPGMGMFPGMMGLEIPPKESTGESYSPIQFETLRKTLLEAIARYGYRMESLPAQEHVLLVAETTSAKSGRVITVSSRPLALRQEHIEELRSIKKQLRPQRLKEIKKRLLESLEKQDEILKIQYQQAFEQRKAQMEDQLNRMKEEGNKKEAESEKAENQFEAELEKIEEKLEESLEMQAAALEGQLETEIKKEEAELKRHLEALESELKPNLEKEQAELRRRLTQLEDHVKRTERISGEETLLTLSRGDYRGIPGGARIRLIRVEKGDIDDPNDDTAEISLNTGSSISSVTLRELDSKFVQDFELTAEDVLPSSGMPGEGRARIRIRRVHDQPAPGSDADLFTSSGPRFSAWGSTYHHPGAGSGTRDRYMIKVEKQKLEKQLNLQTLESMVEEHLY